MENKTKDFENEIEFIKKLYSFEDLNDMKLDENLTMKDVYDELHSKNKTKEKEFNLIIKGKDIKIKNYNHGGFDLKFQDFNLIEIFIHPIKATIQKKTKDLKKITIISAQHYNHILTQNSIVHGVISCECQNLELELITDCFKHTSSKCKIIIKDAILCDYLSKDNFESYFINVYDFEATFDKPESFEKNFEYYINNYEIYKDKEFKLINDDKRKDFIDEIVLCGKFIFDYTSYFGQSGMGKTISIIRASKNMINHLKYGTLYINCKCLYKLIKKFNYNKFKSILIDEIPYLFYNEYYNYYGCVELIYGCEINNKKDILWEFIEKIIIYVLNIIEKRQSPPKSYLFFFDQYNNKIDPENYLKKFYDKYIYNKEKKFNGIGFISLCSMNNDDIREYKFKKLKNKLEADNKKNFHPIKEVVDLFDLKTLKFEDEEKDEYLNLLGRNFKNYNILNNYQSEIEIKNYFEREKYNLTDKIKDFYQYKSNNLNILRLLSFSTESKYNIDDFEKIYKYIPFKYFNPKINEEIHENEKRKYISINYAFPLVEEIISDILLQAIYKDLNLYKTLISETLKFDSYGRGYLFEKLITYYLGTNKNNNNNKFFVDINIDKNIIMNKFIPRKNEKLIKKKEKISLDDGTYLFIQKQMNGKDLDLLIVTIKDNKADIISIQVTIHKPDDKIFNDKRLQEIYLKLKECLNCYYNFSISKDRFSFIYIFDLSYETFNQDGFNSMIDKCKFNKINYLLFDVYNIEFLDSKRKIAKFLKNNVFYPYGNSKLKKELTKKFVKKMKRVVENINFIISPYWIIIKMKLLKL